MAAGTQKFCLQWNEFRGIVTSAFYNLRQDEDFVDVTLCCEGRQIKAHRMMLSACSPYFKTVLKGNPCQHPVFFLKDVSYSDLAAVIEFVYTGEVNVSQNNLSSFLKTAEMLQVKGLANDSRERSTPPPSHSTQSPAHPSRLTPPPPSQPATHTTKRQGSIDTPILSPPIAKRGRLEPTSGSRAPPAPTSGVGPPPPSVDQGRVYPAEWVTSEQPELADLPPPPPPPPPPPLDTAADSGAQQGVTVKTEMGAHDEGHSVDSSLDADGGYAGLLDFKAAEQALAASVDGGAGAPSGTFFSEDASGGHSAGEWIPTDTVAVEGEPRRNECHVCGKTYSHRESLAQHLALHQGLTVCAVCGETLATRKSLKAHMSRVHRLDSRGRPPEDKKS